MVGEKIHVIINGETKTYEEGITYRQIAEEYTKKDPILLVKVNGRLRELFKKAEDQDEIEFETIRTNAGYNTYRRSLVMLMLKAFYHVVGDNQNIDRIGVHFCVGSGYYCTLKGKTVLTQELIDEVKQYMHQLVDRALPITKTTEATYEARRKFGQYRMFDKEELFWYRRASKVNIYTLEKFEDYFYGYMVPDTSYIKYFDLRLFEDGFVLQFPTLSLIHI